MPTDILSQLPLSLIPTFAAPFWIVVHMIAPLQLCRAGYGDRGARA